MKDDDQSFSSWTEAGGCSTGLTATSMARSSAITDMKDKKVLTLSVMPLHDSIGVLVVTDQEKQKQKDVTTTTKICVNVKAADLPPATNHNTNDEDNDNGEGRSSIDIVAALDKSSSMCGNKLRDCRRTLRLMLRHLHSKDRFGLVSYGTEAHVDFPASFMTPENKERALLKIDNIQADGNTNLSGGLSLAFREMNMIDDTPNPVRSIFLLTDGVANMGVVNHLALARMVEGFNVSEDNTTTGSSHDDIEMENNMEGMEVSVDDSSSPMKRLPPPPPTATTTTKNKPPISLFCFGYGANHNSDTLRTMADASPGGAYYFVEQDEDVSTAFGDAMGGLLSVVAQSSVVTLSVPLASATHNVKILKVHHDEMIARANGTFTVNVGDFYAEESRDVVLDIQLSHVPGETPVPHLEVSLTYTDTMRKGTPTIQEGPVVCSIARPPTDQLSSPNVHVEEQWLRVYTAQQMAAAEEAARGNDLDSARNLLYSHKEFLKSSTSYAQGSMEVNALATDLHDVIRSYASKDVYRAVGSHVAQNYHMQMKKQRCMTSKCLAPAVDGQDNTAATGRYATKSKMSLRRNFTTTSSEK